MADLKIDWAKARKDYEMAGMSTGQIAKKYGVSVSAIQVHRKNDGWTRETDVPAEAIVQGFAGPQTVQSSEIPSLAAAQRIAQLERQLYEADKLARAQARELEKHRPTLEWHVYQTPAEVREYLGEEKLRDIAGLQLAEQNRARVKRGLPPFSYETSPEMYEREIGKILEELLTRRTKFVDAGQRLRVVKMAARSAEGGWSIVQIPVEVQINNEAAQSGAAIWKQRDKGRKLVMPYLCQRINCWREALVGPDGKFAYAGYCSSECFGTDPYLNKTPVPGVAMSKAVGM